MINFIKNNFKFILVIGLAASIYFNFNSYDTVGNQRVEIKKIKKELKVAEKRGYFKAKSELVPIISYDTIRDTIKGDIKYIPRKNPINIKLMDKYKALSDSLKTIAYSEAVTNRDYKETFENDTIKIDVKASVTGTLNSIKTSYFIKPYNITYEEIEKTVYKKPRFMFYGGAGFLTSPSHLNGLTFNLSAGIINKKGTHFELSANTKKEIGFSIKKTLFTKY